MSLKKIVLVAVASMALGIGAGKAQASSILEDLQATFASRATFSGQLTFNEDYAGLTGVDGTLTFADNSTDAISWTYWAGTGDGNPQSNAGVDGTYNDWLMDGHPGPDSCTDCFVYFIGLTWDVPVSNNQLTLELSPAVDGFNAGVVKYPYGDPIPSDAMVSYTATYLGTIPPVPEPAPIVMMSAGGLLLFAAWRRNVAA